MTFDISPYRDLYPFTSNYLDFDGLKYHYLDEGQGEPMLMVHGNPTWSFYFRRLVQSFSKDRRIIVPDHMGCGLSDKPDDCQYNYVLENRVKDLEALVEKLQLDNITMVVHDWGGMIGTAFALRHIDKIKRLVILNTAAFLMPSGKKLPWRLWLIRNIAPFAAPAVRGANVFAQAATFMASKKLSPQVKAGLVAPYNSWKNRIATLRFVQDIPLRKNDPSYKLAHYVDENVKKLSHLPMMICWGGKDFVFDNDYFAEWKLRFPNAETHHYPKAGHYVLEDEAENIISAIERFLAKHP